MLSSGISAILLLGGITAHSRCQLPLEINENSTLRITRQSHLGQYWQPAADIIIWDEAVLSSRHKFEALDRLLRELMDCPNSPQLYVALSRSGVPSHTKILIVDMEGKQRRFAEHDVTFTKNIVYREIL